MTEGDLGQDPNSRLRWIKELLGLGLCIVYKLYIAALEIYPLCFPLLQNDKINIPWVCGIRLIKH